MSTHLTFPARIRATRAAREERRQLERELSAYDTPAARIELDAILRRHTPEQRRAVDATLDRLAAKRLANSPHTVAR